MYWQYIMSKSADKWKVEAIHDNGYRMFNFVWDASIRILTHRIKKCTDERLFGRLAKDINSFANICAVFHCGKRFNKMMILLSSVCIDFLDSCCARRGELSPKEAFSKFGLLHKVLELFYSLVHSYGFFI
ncbi:hypothetical protein MHBO_005090 [Bonamia ostreae]|uniref:Telomerase reverse transcriptase n=1 Tax=Bonamia ostreae TaxID=126728 RepID=A0ABV2AV15_9EUKA